MRNGELNWEAKKGNLKARFSILTDSDLHYESDKKDEMLNRLATKLGMSADELQITIITL
jgi:hypothetical protein